MPFEVYMGQKPLRSLQLAIRSKSTATPETVDLIEAQLSKSNDVTEKVDHVEAQIIEDTPSVMEALNSQVSLHSIVIYSHCFITLFL